MRHWLFVASVVVVFGSLGCPGPPEDLQLTCESGVAEVTLAGRVQAEIFDVHCKSCHNTNDPSSGDYSSVDKTSAATVGVTSKYANGGGLKVVDPGKLANSILWLKILGGDSVGRRGPNGERTFGAMPTTGSLPAETQKVLKDWICTGAK